MNAVRCEKDEYYFKRHKGGRFRTERIAELDRKLKALGLEWMQIRRAVNEYFKEHATAVTQPPQSPETPQPVEYTTDTPEPRETAEKRQNRAIGSAQHHQHSALGANGYAMLDDASATMAAMNARHNTLRDTLRSVTYVPREYSTADAPYW